MINRVETTPTVLETGIKVVDLFAPWLRGGTMNLVGWSGTGLFVFLQELSYRFAASQRALSVLTSSALSRRVYHEQAADYAEVNGPDGSPLLTHCARYHAGRDATPAARVRAFEDARAGAEAMQSSGRSALLVVMDAHALQSAREELRRGGAATMPSAPWFERRGVDGDAWLTTLVVHRLVAEGFAEPEPSSFAGFDATMRFARRMADIGIYPAVDAAACASAQLDPRVVGERHARVAAAAREALVRYDALQASLYEGTARELSAEETTLTVRARRLRKFFSQSFYAAAPWTGLAGSWVTRAQTVSDCEAILAGEADDLSEAACYLVGTLEEARAKHAKSG